MHCLWDLSSRPGMEPTPLESTTGPPGKSPRFLTVKASRRKRKRIRRAGWVGNGRGLGTRSSHSPCPPECTGNPLSR